MRQCEGEVSGRPPALFVGWIPILNLAVRFSVHIGLNL